MHELRIAVATACFRQPLRRAIDTAARSGAQGVQFDARNEVKPADFGETARRQLRHALSERELRVASLTFPLRRPLAERERLDERLEALRRAMEFTAQLGSRVLTCRVGRIPTDRESPEYGRLFDSLQDLARFGNHVGVALAITPSGDAADTLNTLIRDTRSGPLGVDFDPAGCLIAGRHPTAMLRDLHAVVAHIQVRDALRDVDGVGRETPVGRGEVDWDELAAIIDQMKYPGWLTVRRTEGSDPITETANAVAYVRNVATIG